MRSERAPGDKILGNYSGLTMDIVDRASGEVQKADVYVAAQGASNF
jgi:transposase